MYLKNIFEDEELNYDMYVDPGKDNAIPSLSDLRKTKLTLGDINRMRLIRDVRNFEQQSNLENIKKQYGRSQEATPGI